MGLVDYVVDSDQVDATALSLSQQMGLRGPVALRMAKRAINQSAQGPIEQGMKIEQECYAQVFLSCSLLFQVFTGLFFLQNPSDTSLGFST